MSIDFAPPSIIFVNQDLTDQVLSVFVRQLYITQVLDGYTFDGYVSSDAYFEMNVYIDGYRILVVRDLHDYTNREKADLVLFAKDGLVSVLCNKYGPPGKTLTIDRCYYSALIEQNKFLDCCIRRRNYYSQFVGQRTNNNFNPHRLDYPLNVVPPGL